MAVRAQRVSPAYERLQRLLADDVAVILDGGNATELFGLQVASTQG